MTKIKIFAGYSYEVERDVNDFLSNESIRVKDIQYEPTSRQMSTTYSVMIVYEEKES